MGVTQIDDDKLPKTIHLDSLLSCGTDDKCYCSLSDGVASADTTWCDSDSCISYTKCYCKAKREASILRRQDKYASDNLALDYELFTIGSGCMNGSVGANKRNGMVETRQNVKESEALSAKKTVEMAALFADFKLSQSTDIKNLVKERNSRTASKCDFGTGKSGTSKSAQKLIMNLEAKRVVAMTKASTTKTTKSHHDDDNNVMVSSSATAQQRPVSSTLEDSLGYLP